MTFQDAMPETGTLFARKGEATPVGGRPAPRRMITMRAPSSEDPARLTGALLARKRAALPRPANTFAPARLDAAVETAPIMILPVMGPVAGAPNLLGSGAKPASPNHARTYNPGPVIRGPVLPVSADTKRPAPKRTTLRIDDALRARLARCAASETRSVQALLTRGLERFLPAFNIQRAHSIQSPGVAAASETQSGRRSVRFDAHLYWRLRTAAAKRKGSMQSIMVAALTAYLDELEATGRAEDGAEMASMSARPMTGPIAGAAIGDMQPLRLAGAA